MPEYKHWANRQDEQRTMFVTTTCRGFAHLLGRETTREKLTAKLADDVDYYNAKLHAFCIMPHHLHLVIQSPPGKSMSWFMQRFKSNSAKWLEPQLTPEERLQMGDCCGQQGRKFWMVSFRGIPLLTERAFWKCITYIHLNPVRWGLCERIEDYRWSSGRMFESGLWSEEDGINRAMLTDFCQKLLYDEGKDG